MTSVAHVSDMEAHAPAEPAAQLTGWIKSVGRRIAASVSACADYYAAASLYDELRGLSDAELRHRGLSRDTLARDVCQSADAAAWR